MKLDDIKIGDRVRKDMGDIAGLAMSMQHQGLLHPVVVKSDGTLVAGHRRIEAARLLGCTEISATVIDVEDLLQAEHDENAQRKDFTPTEAVAIGREIEERHKEKVKAHQSEHMRRAVQMRKDRSGSFIPPVERVGESRDMAAKAVGVSPATYSRAKRVVEAAEADPERFGDLPAKMDETGNVTGTLRELERRGGAKPVESKPKPRHEIHRNTHHPKVNQMVMRAIDALDGICLGLEQIDTTKADQGKVKDWAESLEESAANIRRFAKRLKNVEV